MKSQTIFNANRARNVLLFGYFVCVMFQTKKRKK